MAKEGSLSYMLMTRVTNEKARKLAERLVHSEFVLH